MAFFKIISLLICVTFGCYSIKLTTCPFKHEFVIIHKTMYFVFSHSHNSKASV